MKFTYLFHRHTPFSPSLISLMVSVDVKHIVYLKKLTDILCLYMITTLCESCPQCWSERTGPGRVAADLSSRGPTDGPTTRPRRDERAAAAQGTRTPAILVARKAEQKEKALKVASAPYKANSACLTLSMILAHSTCKQGCCAVMAFSVRLPIARPQSATCFSDFVLVLVFFFFFFTWRGGQLV